MGMFDHIVADCPSCGGRLYGQTKVGDCSLNTYHITPEMEANEANVVNGEELYCILCSITVVVRSEPQGLIKVTLEIKE